MVEGLGTRENQCWYDVKDRVEGKGSQRDQFCVVEED